MHRKLEIRTQGQGLYEITAQVLGVLNECPIEDGLCNIFIQHTSASLLIQENADYTAKSDLESWINRLIPENDPDYTHTCEGSDDMPAHIKSAITSSCLTIPIISGTLGLGQWQGIYLWEHRSKKHLRSLIITCLP